tara:strand:+ start:1130 stop:1267 length:138 start_codon:yes stop_codon:yes gene_type:complete
MQIVDERTKKIRNRIYVEIERVLAEENCGNKKTWVKNQKHKKTVD